MIQELIEQAVEYISVKNFSFLLYGSSAINILQGRDIDSIVISPDFNDVQCIQFMLKINQEMRICNLYLVSDQIYLNDVYNMEHGGYYANKFALSFKEILRKGTSLDAPLTFWLNEYNLYQKSSSEILKNSASDPGAFIRFVHYKIFKYRPTFIYPLQKFISNANRKQYLIHYIVSTIFNRELLTMSPLSVDIDKIYNENQEKAFYKFWSEYNKHKDKNSSWGENTLMKMKRSFEGIDFLLIKEYFNLNKGDLF